MMMMMMMIQTHRHIMLFHGNTVMWTCLHAAFYVHCLSGHYFITHSRVGRKLGESSLFLRISLHLLTVSKRRKVSPTLNSVARQRAISLRVGGPGDSWMCCVNCSTSFFWQPLMSDCNKTAQRLYNAFKTSKQNTTLDDVKQWSKCSNSPRPQAHYAKLHLLLILAHL